jgi:pimeloyl-ACP methyl ester carboxylesterase
MPFLNIGRGRLEYERFDADVAGARTIVMLHEGLGSVSLWRDFPEELARTTGSNVIVYSRHGYGKSAAVGESRPVRYMHDEALIVLPQLLDALEVEKPILFGHSDGGSIALIYAGGNGRTVGGVIALAPHVFVEDVSVSSIAATKVAYETTPLREKLARHHDDVDGVFWGWNDIWLNPEFRAWNIEEYLPRIACPVLVIQGEEDEYGTMEQVRRIERGAKHVQTLCLAECRHSPHRDQPQRVLDAAARWISTVAI